VEGRPPCREGERGREGERERGRERERERGREAPVPTEDALCGLSGLGLAGWRPAGWYLYIHIHTYDRTDR